MGGLFRTPLYLMNAVSFCSSWDVLGKGNYSVFPTVNSPPEMGLIQTADKKKIRSRIASTISSHWSRISLLRERLCSPVGLALESNGDGDWFVTFPLLGLGKSQKAKVPKQPISMWSHSDAALAGGAALQVFLKRNKKTIGTTILAQTKDPSSAASYFQQGPWADTWGRIITGEAHVMFSTKLLPRLWLFLAESIFWTSCHLSVTLNRFFFQVVG